MLLAVSLSQSLPATIKKKKNYHSHRLGINKQQIIISDSSRGCKSKIT